MNILHKIKNKLIYILRRYILRDHFLIEVDRWFRDKGDETLRLNYPLTSESIVFDLGGYHGDFAAAIYERYGCRVFVFEPVPAFYEICAERFRGNTKVACFNYGLSSADATININLAENASSTISNSQSGTGLTVNLKSVANCIRNLNIKSIDLMKINIEGGEFDVLPAMIDSDDMKKVVNLQVQFHNFVDDAIKRRKEIQDKLYLTHELMWNYEFVWESWKVIDSHSGM